MANIYLYFDKRRPQKDGSGALKIALSHNQKVAYQALGIHIKPSEWDASAGLVIERPDKRFLNAEIRKRLMGACAKLMQVEASRMFQVMSASDALDLVMSAEPIVEETPRRKDNVLRVYQEYIELCKKDNTRNLFKSSLKNLRAYCEDFDSLSFCDINVAWIKRYQNWLLDDMELTVNGSNVYLRNLRAVFNHALKNEYTKARYPFLDIDMSTTEPEKEMVPYEQFIEWASFPMADARGFYRDLFMLSFYLCGIRPVDLLHLKRENIVDGRLVYRPEKLNGRKTLSIKIEPEAWELIRKYEGKEYLIDVLDTRTDYKSCMAHWMRGLREIGKDELYVKVGRNGKKYTSVKHNGIIPHIKIYDSRRYWATYAYNIAGIPVDTISQALGHKSGLRVTNFYVKRDSSLVDKANRELIDRVTADLEERLSGGTASA